MLDEEEIRPHSEYPGVYVVDSEGSRKLATQNLSPGIKPTEEKTFTHDGREFREWDPHRSKLAASLLKGMDAPFLREHGNVLYLGSATGTTVSHISDAVGDHALIFAIEKSSRSMREFLERVAKHRVNTLPILADASRPETYDHLVFDVDYVYCDIAQPDQTEIAIRNHLSVATEGVLYLAIKASSIDVSAPETQVFEEESAKLEERGFRILDSRRLEPYQKGHEVVLATVNR